MESAPKAKALHETKTESRPTISLQRVLVTGPDTTTFTGWGPKVNGLGSILKN